jgi:hypothetical protein
MTNESLQEEKRRIEAAIRQMQDDLDGCDWCCGGGNERMEDLKDRLVEIAKLEAQTAPSAPGVVRSDPA